MSTPDRFQLAIPVSARDHSLGPDDAGLTLVEYIDFECPNCKQTAPVIRMLVEQHADDIRLVIRHFPLEEVHPHALLAAQAAEAAHSQGKFWPMHDLLYAHQANLENEHLKGYAAQLGLDVARFSSEIEQQIHLQTVRAQMKGGEHSGVRGTPGIFLNGKILDTSLGPQSLKKAVEQLLP